MRAAGVLTLVAVLVLAVAQVQVQANDDTRAWSKLTSLKSLVESGSSMSVYGTCSNNGASGACVAESSCRGVGKTVFRGKCPGPAPIICCITSAAAKPKPNTKSDTATATDPATPTPAPGPSTPATPASGASAFDAMLAAATSSKCASHTFTSQTRGKQIIAGKPPKAFVRGVVATFAKAVCEPTRPDVVFAGQATIQGKANDIFNNYAPHFAKHGMKSTAGLTNLRHVYTVLMGLGMCESGGRYCTGRDMSADFSDSNSAESGLFQTSYQSKNWNSVLPNLMATYSSSSKGCFKDIFSENIKCRAGDLKNWGSGKGLEWQTKTKECPAFAVEWAAVLLRLSGGPKGEWGPLRKQYAQLRPECGEMLSEVQKSVQANAAICKHIATMA